MPIIISIMYAENINGLDQKDNINRNKRIIKKEIINEKQKK